MLAVALDDGCEAVKGPCIVWLEGDGFAEKGFSGLRVLSVAEVEVAEDDPVGGIGGVEAEEFDEVIGGGVDVAGFHAAHREVAPGIVEGGLEVQGAIQQINGAGEVAFGGVVSGLLGESSRFCLRGGGFFREGNEDIVAFDGDAEGLGEKRKLLKDEGCDGRGVGGAVRGWLPVKLEEVGDLEAKGAHEGAGARS